MGYNWKDDYVEDGNLKDGWYYIRTWEDMASEFGCNEDYIDGVIIYTKNMEDKLPPTRCIKVENGISGFGGLSCYITPDMIESPAFTIGKEYEFSDSGVDWIIGKYGAYKYYGIYRHVSIEYSGYKYCREILHKEPEIKITKGGKEVVLPDKLVKAIREVINN
jgi:hypothetical protein